MQDLERHVAAMLEGDQGALARIYRGASALVYATALRIVRDFALAEEITEDVFVAAWRNAARFDPARGSAQAWLIAMCRSRALDALRARARQLPQHDADSLELEGRVPDPCDLLEATRRDSDLHLRLSRLPPLQRQLLAMGFFRGYSHAEIAERMDMPLGTVKSHMRRALATLAGSLVEESDDE